jgi:uncharacterized protein involved in cysteine biosynthesis
MIGWKLSRTIIEIPWLHDTIGLIFLLFVTSYLLGIPYLLYKAMKSSGQKQIEWSFEGKNWDYWKKKR